MRPKAETISPDVGWILLSVEAIPAQERAAVAGFIHGMREGANPFSGAALLPDVASYSRSHRVLGSCSLRRAGFGLATRDARVSGAAFGKKSFCGFLFGPEAGPEWESTEQPTDQFVAPGALSRSEARTPSFDTAAKEARPGESGGLSGHPGPADAEDAGVGSCPIRVLITRPPTSEVSPRRRSPNA